MRKQSMRTLKTSMACCTLLVGLSAAGLVSAAETAPLVQSSPAVTEAMAKAAITEKVLTSTNPNLTTNIKVPQLTGLSDKKYQDQLNDILLSHANKDLEHWSKEADKDAAALKASNQTFRPYELTIIYQLKSDGSGYPAGVVSLEVITQCATGGTGMPRVDTYTFHNTKEASRVTLEGLFGKDYKAYINKKIAAQVQKQPDNYFADVSKEIADEQSFYIQGGDAVIVFPKYSIAPGAAGTPEFRIGVPSNPDNVNVQELDMDPAEKFGKDLTAYQIKTADGTTWVPLRLAAERLGYVVIWDAKTKSAELRMLDQKTTVTLGKDAYAMAGQAPVSLGAAPMLRDGSMYVPLKYADEMLLAGMIQYGGGAPAPAAQK